MQGRRGTVVKVEKQARQERPPLLYDLTSLQQAANARYAFSAAHTLTLAQSLYEKTFITYPRTASRHLSSSVNRELRATSRPPASARIFPLFTRSWPWEASALHRATLTTRKSPTTTPSSPQRSAWTRRHSPRREAPVRPHRPPLPRRFTRTPSSNARRSVPRSRASATTRGTVVLAAGWQEVDPPRSARQAPDDAAEAVEALPPVRVQDAVETRQAETLTKHTKAPPRYS